MPKVFSTELQKVFQKSYKKKVAKLFFYRITKSISAKSISEKFSKKKVAKVFFYRNPKRYWTKNIG